MEKILSNKARCRKCGEVVESVEVHDFRTCKCGAISVDGGREYLERLGNAEDIEEMSEVEELPVQKYPFLFRKPPAQCRTTPEEWASADGADHYFVYIAKSFNYTSYDSSWMCEENLGDFCLTPDLDICDEVHEFGTEEEALRFIREWWGKN